MTQPSFEFPAEPADEAVAAEGAEHPAVADDVDPTLTVTELNDRIGRALRVGLPGRVWVRGEIQGLGRPSSAGHLYFSLVDASSGRHHVDSVLRVALFNRTREVVERQLRRTGDLRLADGLEVRIEGSVDHHGPTGQLSLRMTGIDPEHTLGRLAVDRSHLLRKLAAEGLMGRNGALRLPVLPWRIGLVGSTGTAGYRDFLAQLAESGIGWHVVVSDARVQGASASRSVARAIRRLGAADVDVIVVIRGGGARSDLSVFDAEPIARAVADAPVPVITGIGHEIDSSVADAVAHTSCKTPTACAALLVERVAAFRDDLEATYAGITARAERTLAGAQQRLDARTRTLARDTRSALDLADQRVAGAARIVARDTRTGLAAAELRVARAAGRAGRAGHGRLAAASAQLTRAEADLGHRSTRALADAGRRLDAAAAQVRAVDPARLLALGWSITTTDDGRAVRSVSELAPGQVVHTRLADGRATSRVEQLDAAPGPDTDPGGSLP